MSGKRLRSGKQLTILGSHKQREHEPPKENRKVTPTHEDAMTAEVLQELKSMRSELTGQIRKLSADLIDFQQDTNARLVKIESAMSKIDEIEILNNKAQVLDEEVDRIKVSLTSTKSTVEAMDSKMEDSFKKLQESNRELKNKLEHLERYSRDFNIRLIGVEEEEGEDCMTIVLDHFTLLGFEEAHGELENAHRTGRRQDGKPRHIIAKLYARPFKRNLLRAAKNPQNKNLLNGVRLVEDFTPGDFELRKKALPMMKKAFEEGKKVRFTKGKLLIDGKAVPVQ